MRDGIATFADLDLARAEGRSSVAGPALLAAADLIAAERDDLTLGRATDVLDSFIPAITSRCPALTDAVPSGAARRMCPIVPDLIVVAQAAVPSAAIDCIAEAPVVSAVLHRTERRLVVTFQGYEIDVRIAAPDEYGSVLLATTGPGEHVAGILTRRGAGLRGHEDEVYARAGLPFVPPELRDAPDAAEIASRAGAALVTVEAIRGDLHMHTTYSDGRDTVHDMIAACSALGYEYVAITDHSENAGASRTVRADQLKRQAEEIARVRDRFPHMTILHGLEVDILPDGTLDCPERTLASLDIVVASLHERAGHDRARLTERCLGAIRHPLVSIISHPSNQLVGHRRGYDMDYDAIYEAAAATGTALEVDGAPSHLDLDGARARAAIAAGVTLTIDSDCHRAKWLGRQMRFGVGTARRGGVTVQNVLNTRPVDELQGFLRRKRAPA
jgi:DNA polymerase (family 10)